MNAVEIRKKFIDFFEKNGHTVVSSSSLIPAEDPTLLFTNAGMNQFKDVFLGKENRSYTRATSIQKCVRAGGKHNDLDQVGFTARHLTFFEMMGNFSFGDYFKKEAIKYAWEFLTKEMSLPAEKLYPSVFREDQEAYDLWLNEVGVPGERIIKLGEADNFWAMGDTGPCGPCSEIYLDRGVETGCKQKSCLPGCECDRFIEIWNLVFMQYNRQADGILKPLDQTGVDTGMGFERLCMVMQGEDNVFRIDSMQYLIQAVEKITRTNYKQADKNLQAAYHVLADHVRTCSLLIADGCSPSNDGRGYVLRKIIRRAALFAQKLTDDQKLFSKLAQLFINTMSTIYPELKRAEKIILSVLDSEIERFAINLINGQKILQRYFEENTQKNSSIISGEQAFKLYDTYGFPLELTQLISSENNFSVDIAGFEVEMDQQKEQSGKKMKTSLIDDFSVESLSTTFVGYDVLECSSKIQFVSQADGFIWISTEESPFYVESGGQVDDQGTITINDQTFKVIELKKEGDTFNPAILVKVPTTTIDGKPAKKIAIGDLAESTVDKNIRPSTVKNHTATHMLQAALLEILGPHVKQAGSVVHEKYLRFDFTHHKAMTKEEITRVEDLINKKIQDDIKTKIYNTSLQAAKETGIISFFGEKYNPEDVRVVEIPGFSAELCGGTHVESTGTIGCFKIVSETALSTGTRRIVAVTGPEALKLFRQSFDIANNLGTRFSVKLDEVEEAIEKLQAHHQEALTMIKHLKKQLNKASLPLWLQQIDTTLKIPFLYLELEDCANDEMKNICCQLEKTTPGFYFLISTSSKDTDRFAFLGYLSKQHTQDLDLQSFGKYLRETFGIKGGGSTSFMQGGGINLPSSLEESIIMWLKEKN